MRTATARRFTALALALCGVAGIAGAQQATDPELRRIVASARGASPAATLDALGSIQAFRLSVHDRAILELFRGFALHRSRRSADAEAALQRAAAIDPTLIPEPDVTGQDFVDAYRVARARIPIIAAFSVSPLEFIPQIDSVTRLAYQIEGGRILRRGRAQLRFIIAKRGSADSAVVWRGSEADSNAAWNGLIDGRLVEPGEYDYVLEARGPDIPIASHRSRLVRIERFPVDSTRLLRRPLPPAALPESSVFMVEDRERKSVLMRRGVLVGGVGALMAVGASRFVQMAIDRTPPRSGMRYAVAGTYVAGLTAIAVGGIIAWRSKSGRFRSEVAFPNNENIRLNRQLRTEYAAELERVNRYNDTLRRATVLKQTFLDGTER